MHQPFTLSVLIVDDDAFQQAALSACLENLGVTRIATYTGEHAGFRHFLQQAREADLILCDLQMPEMDGIEILRALHEQQCEAAILLISGENPKILDTALRLAQEYKLNVLGALSKPVTTAALQPILAQLASSRGAKRQAPPEQVRPEALTAAITRDQLCLHYQPQVAASDKRVVGAEALVRWRTPEGNMIPPGAFIPVAERYGLIHALTERVIQMALDQAAAWKTQGITLPLSINLSMDNLNDLKFPQMLVRETERRQLNPAMITLEITESRLAKNLTSVLDILLRLRLKGFPLSIDDFGTGYSSLEQLRELPFTELKIDRGFIHQAHANPARLAIVAGSIGMAHACGLKTVAEGVEDEADWKTAAELHSDVIQGFYIARPMPADAFREWLAHWMPEKTLDP